MFNNREIDLKFIEESTISYTDVYKKKLINAFMENISISCNNLILKFIEDNIVIRVDVKSFTLNSNTDDWMINIESIY